MNSDSGTVNREQPQSKQTVFDIQTILFLFHKRYVLTSSDEERSAGSQTSILQSLVAAGKPRKALSQRLAVPTYLRRF